MVNVRDRLDSWLLPDLELAPVEWRLGEGLTLLRGLQVNLVATALTLLFIQGVRLLPLRPEVVQAVGRDTAEAAKATVAAPS